MANSKRCSGRADLRLLRRRVPKALKLTSGLPIASERTLEDRPRFGEVALGLRPTGEVEIRRRIGMVRAERLLG